MAFSVYADGSLLYSSIDLGEDKIINPKVKAELNKAGSFSFTMLPSHSMYSSLYPMKTLITVIQDGVQLFRGRVVTCKKDFYKQMNVTCEGDLAFLLDSIVAPFKYVGTKAKTIRYIFKKIVDEHNSQVENWKRFSYDDNYINVTKDETSSVSSTDEFDHTSYNDSSSTLTQELLDAYGGVIRTRTVGNTTYLDYVKDPYQDISSYPINDQEIRFSVNLLNIDENYPVNDIFTVLLPLGGDKLTIKSVNNGSMYLENPEAIAKFGRIVKVEEWSDERNVQRLLKKAREYLSVHSRIYPNEFTIKALDLHYLDSSNTQLKLGDRVRCVSEPHGIDETLVCLSIDYDLQNPENNSYKIGPYIKSDKHKGKISKSSSKGGGGKSRKGSSGTSLSSYVSGTAEENQETKEDEKEDLWTSVKNHARLLVGELTEDAGEVLTPVVQATGNDFSIDNLIDDSKNVVFPMYEVTDRDGNVITDDQGNPVTETVSDLLHTGNEIYNINADIVEINARKIEINASERIDMNSPVISLTSSLETFIGGYKITIGDDETDYIELKSKNIVLTGLIEELIVNKLSAKQIDSFTISVAGELRTSRIYSNSAEFSGKVIVPTLPSNRDMRCPVNVSELNAILAGQKSGYNSDAPYATQAWVNANFVHV